MAAVLIGSIFSIPSWSCWFKVHHPAAPYPGLINHPPLGFHPTHSLTPDAKRVLDALKGAPGVDAARLQAVLRKAG